MNHFATLHLPVSLVLESSTIDDAWRSATAEHHPDLLKEEENPEVASDVNRARSILSDPVLRLDHWLSVLHPESEPDRSIDPTLMDLFSTIHESLGKADSVLSRHKKATTALTRALLTKEAVAAQLSIQKQLQETTSRKQTILDRYPEFEEQSANGSFADAEKGLNQLKFLRKWEQQCQERLLGLIEC